MLLLDSSFAQSGERAAYTQAARVLAVALIGLIMKFLARKDVSTKETIEFSRSPRKARFTRGIAFLNLLLLAGLFLLIPRIQNDLPGSAIPGIAVGTILSAGALIIIGLYLWKLDRSLARGAVLSVVVMVAAYALICRYGD